MFNGCLVQWFGSDDGLELIVKCLAYYCLANHSTMWHIDYLIAFLCTHCVCVCVCKYVCCIAVIRSAKETTIEYGWQSTLLYRDHARLPLLVLVFNAFVYMCVCVCAFVCLCQGTRAVEPTSFHLIDINININRSSWRLHERQIYEASEWVERGHGTPMHTDTWITVDALSDRWVVRVRSKAQYILPSSFRSLWWIVFALVSVNTFARPRRRSSGAPTGESLFLSFFVYWSTSTSTKDCLCAENVWSPDADRAKSGAFIRS